MKSYPKKEISYFAKTNFRNDRKVFGIKQSDRFSTLIIGKSGTGKSNLLRTLIHQDILHNRGLCVFDLHNDLIPEILNNLPHHRMQDVVYLDIPNPQMRYRYNPLKKVSKEKQGLVASGIIETFKKMYASSWGSRLEYLLLNIILTLLKTQNTTFADIPRMINDVAFRNTCVKNISDNKILYDFWTKEFPKYSKSDVLPILSKVNALLSYPAVKRFLIDNKDEISLREIMDNKKILLINVNKGSLGSEVASIISSLLLTSITNAGFSRVDMPEHERHEKVFHIYCDEYAQYANKSSVNMMSELRKYGITKTMAIQYLSSFSNDIRDAVLGNVQTQIIFRLSQQDAKYYEREFKPIFTSNDITSLANYEIYLSMMIDGTPSKPFSATTIRYSDYFY